MMLTDTCGARRSMQQASVFMLAVLGSMWVRGDARSASLEEAAPILRDGRIGYVITHRYWSDQGAAR